MLNVLDNLLPLGLNEVVHERLLTDGHARQDDATADDVPIRNRIIPPADGRIRSGASIPRTGRPASSTSARWGSTRDSVRNGDGKEPLSARATLRGVQLALARL